MKHPTFGGVSALMFLPSLGVGYRRKTALESVRCQAFCSILFGARRSLWDWKDDLVGKVLMKIHRKVQHVGVY